MKTQSNDLTDFRWEESRDLLDPAHLQRLKLEIVEGIQRSLSDPRPDISSEDMRTFIDDLQRDAAP